MILQCGDFGYWPHFHEKSMLCWYSAYEISKMRKHDRNRLKNTLWNQYSIETNETCIFWCDGNHDNHEYLLKLVEEKGRIAIEIMPHVFYMPRGSVLTLPDNRNVLFMGGAESTDRERRIEGVSWWPGELISQRDFMYLPDFKIDIVISHTLPSVALEKIESIIPSNPKYNDPCRIALNEIYLKYKPKLWFAGHFHTQFEIDIEQTQFVVLGILDGGAEGWVEL